MHCPNCGHDRLATHRPQRSARVDTRHMFCEACHVHVETETRITHVFARRTRGAVERLPLAEFERMVGTAPPLPVAGRPGRP